MPFAAPLIAKGAALCSSLRSLLGLTFPIHSNVTVEAGILTSNNEIGNKAFASLAKSWESPSSALTQLLKDFTLIFPFLCRIGVGASIAVFLIDAILVVIFLGSLPYGLSGLLEIGSKLKIQKIAFQIISVLKWEYMLIVLKMASLFIVAFFLRFLFRNKGQSKLGGEPLANLSNRDQKPSRKRRGDSLLLVSDEMKSVCLEAFVENGETFEWHQLQPGHIMMKLPFSQDQRQLAKMSSPDFTLVVLDFTLATTPSQATLIDWISTKIVHDGLSSPVLILLDNFDKTIKSKFGETKNELFQRKREEVRQRKNQFICVLALKIASEHNDIIRTSRDRLIKIYQKLEYERLNLTSGEEISINDVLRIRVPELQLKSNQTLVEEIRVITKMLESVVQVSALTHEEQCQCTKLHEKRDIGLTSIANETIQFIRQRHDKEHTVWTTAEVKRWTQTLLLPRRLVPPPPSPPKKFS